jgi:hypothetical protein
MKTVLVSETKHCLSDVAELFINKISENLCNKYNYETIHFYSILFYEVLSEKLEDIDDDRNSVRISDCMKSRYYKRLSDYIYFY